MTDLIIDRFPSIKKAYIEMVYDNGGVFNGMGRVPSRSEQDALEASDPVLSGEGVTEDDLQRLNDWLATLTDEQIDTLVAGEEQDQIALSAQGPHGGPDNTPLTKIFDDLFEVC